MRHHWLSVLSILSAVLLTDLATPPAPPWDDVRVMHTWNSVPANWEFLGPPPATATIDLYIALKPHRESALIDALYKVSDPEHQNVPSSSISTSHGGGWLTITNVPVSQADELLCASYQLYGHTGTNKTETILRTVSYALPVALHGHVQMVAPTTNFASPHIPLQTPGKRSSEEAAVMVNATSGERVRVLSRRADDRNRLGILGFKNDYPIKEDLAKFMAEYREDAKAATFEVDTTRTNPGAEASVDVQYTAAIAYPTPEVFYSTGGPISWQPGNNLPASSDGYLAWFKYLLSQPSVPATISISYGNPEPSLPLMYTTILCNLFAQLGLRGASVIIGSGDHGVGLGDCKDSSGNVRFIPIFPASCPWVTSVGATKGFVPEVAMDISGGGFSHHFPRPVYQDRAVTTFLEDLGLEHAGLYNSRGRGIPDIAAQGDRFMLVLANEYYRASGTSCATPAVAGIVSLLNDYRLSTGRKPLGFLNFWLYGSGRVGFKDITLGNNPGCGTNGFSATAGWDPVSGLGSPNFQGLQKTLQNWM
ncbi:subtilisin-like protein [Lactarius psammicola]|nr:subtilisin-like protein [Lactarius psammicola]